MRYARNVLCGLRAIPLGIVVNTLMPVLANAHVKWFCAFNVAGQPRGLENVLCPDFEELVLLAFVVLVAAGLLEKTTLGAALQRAVAAFMEPVRLNTEVLLRAVCGFFFVALWTTGGILLTPELKTASTVIPWFQLAIAFALLWRGTLVFSAVGIVALFSIALRQYGAFHLLDYPIFLGFAAYLALVGLDRRPFGVRPLDVLRWATAVTLMWASIEKWAYPEWSFPLFAAHGNVTMGFSSEFFMRAAGMVEFGLSFALIWTPLFRRFAAIILAGMFIGAIFEFGKIDAIGHAPIIAAMLAVAADDGGLSRPMPRVLWAPVGFAGALAGFLVVYYVAHAALFGTTIV